MIWFVTGGAGFIGSHFIYYLLEHYPDDEIVCFDALTYAGNRTTLAMADNNPHFRFIRGDIADRELVFKLFAALRPNVVVNFAAESHVDRSIKQADIFLMTNIMGVQVLLDACLTYEVDRFHQVSTDEVYGDLPLDQRHLLFTEQSPLLPSNPYAASKAAADLLTLAFARTHGLDVSITRSSNNYGPYHFPEKLIPLVITRALHDQTIPVYGTGDNVRDWLYVKDHCIAIDRVVREGHSSAIYNVGGNNEISNLDLVKIILRTLNKPESLITFVADRPGHDKRYAIDSTKLQSELAWAPTMCFANGIQQTVAWYIDNDVWWQAILNGDYQRYYTNHYGKQDT